MPLAQELKGLAAAEEGKKRPAEKVVIRTKRRAVLVVTVTDGESSRHTTKQIALVHDGCIGKAVSHERSWGKSRRPCACRRQNRMKFREGATSFWAGRGLLQGPRPQRWLAHWLIGCALLCSLHSVVSATSRFMWSWLCCGVNCGWCYNSTSPQVHLRTFQVGGTKPDGSAPRSHSEWLSWRCYD